MEHELRRSRLARMQEYKKERYSLGALELKKKTWKDVIYACIVILIVVAASIHAKPKQLISPIPRAMAQTALDTIDVTRTLLTPSPTRTPFLESLLTPETPSITPTPTATPPSITDKRAKILEERLNDVGSPMAAYAQLIVEQADLYDIGWTRLVAISRMESDYGINTLSGSYNAWGLGGDNFMYFSSWDESIRYASRLLGKHYQLNANYGIKEKYCPSSDNCNPAWADTVTDEQATLTESLQGGN